MLLRFRLADWCQRALRLFGQPSTQRRGRRGPSRIRLRTEQLETRQLLTTVDLGSLGLNGSTITAPARSGYSLSSAGDVNGDGYDDVIIGINARAYVIFGSEDFESSIDLEAMGSRGIRFDGLSGQENLGNSVSGGGDLNGDGYDDLVIGSNFGDKPGGRDNCGVTYVIYGKATLPEFVDLTQPGTADVRVYGAFERDFSGGSVANAGDVNGDGFDDVIIGAFRYHSSQGTAYIIFGGESIPAEIDLRNLGTAGTRIKSVFSDNRTGIAVAGAGDVNGDGLDDVLVGADNVDGVNGTTSNTGGAYLVYGQTSFPAVVDLATLGTGGVTLFGIDLGDRAGDAVGGAGDVNGDGFADFLIGCQHSDGVGNAYDLEGESYLIFGGPALPATIELSALGTAGVTFYGGEWGDEVGTDVSGGGDVNGDGFDDFIIGARGVDGYQPQPFNSGAGYLIFGGPTFPTTLNLDELGDRGIAYFCPTSGGQGGNAVSTLGDVNGDGLADAMIGASFANTTWLIFGSSTTNNHPPIFQSAAEFTVDENVTSVGTVVAVDADIPPQTVTYSISGGPDQARFAITSDGLLTLIDPPDFENPTDVGINNVYNVRVAANDGQGGVAIQNIVVTVNPVNEFAPEYSSTAEFYVAEGTTTVGDVVAVDADLPGQTVVYTITGGVDQRSFSLTPAGLLTFVTPPSFSSPADAGLNNVYEVQVTADDGHGLQTTQDITIRVYPEHVNTPPVFVSPMEFTVPENQAEVGFVLAVDPDLPGSFIDYLVVGGPDEFQFEFRPGGLLTFFAPVDYEAPVDANGDNVYHVVILARDFEDGESFQDIYVTVTPVNDNAPEFTSSQTFNVVEGTTAVGIVTAIDSDLPFQFLNYSLSGGDEAALFSITAGGALKFIAAPDFDAPADVGADNIYHVQVTVDDGEGGQAFQDIAITVTPANDNSPEFVSPATFEVAENTAAVGTIVATDADTPSQTVTLAITGGADKAKFSLLNGQLRFVTAPDFESPTDAGTDNVYELQVTADDGNGGLTVQNIAVTVTPVSDNAPVFTSLATFSIPENTTAVATVVATDADLPRQTVSYSISGGIDQARFSITAGGVLTFVTAPDFENPTDFGANNTYNVQITANDGHGSTTVQSVAVSITPVNDNPLVFSSSGAFALPENTTAVGTIVAADADLPAPVISYSITGGADAAKFTLTGGGVLSLIAAPNFEQPDDSGANHVYDIQVTADNGQGQTTVQTIAVTVTPVNDNSPVITSAAAFSVSENTTAVGTLSATDADLPAQTIAFSITGGPDATRFSLTAAGVLTFFNAPDFENPTDAGADHVYNIQVTANDGLGRTSVQNVSVTVLPENDNAPVFSSPASFNIAENSSTVGNLVATDADLPSPTLTYAISGGVDAGKFVLSGGTLFFLAPPDFENPTDAGANNVYNVQVTASDGTGHSTVQDIAVTVTAMNDNNPVFTTLGTLSIPENSLTVSPLVATDADLPVQNLIYSLSGGADQVRFAITSNGVLSFLTAPDFENPIDAGTNNVYNVQVRVDDGQGRFALRSFTVTVSDADEVAPTVAIDIVVPDLRHTPVDSISIVFNEPVTGFDLSDLTLTLSGGSNLLNGLQSLTTADGATYVLSGLADLTSAAGVYLLSLNAAASGITDEVGLALPNDASQSWTMDATLPSVNIGPVSPDPRATAVDSLTIVFSETVLDFDLSDLQLTLDGGPNLLTDVATLTTSDNVTYTLGNLGSLTGATGHYELALNSESSGIHDVAGNLLTDSPVESWDRIDPTVSLSVNKATIAEAGEMAVVTATLSEVTDRNVTVVIGFSGSAAFPDDYSRSATQIVISAGNLTGSVTIAAAQDAEFEADETIVVDITDVTNGVEDGTQQVITGIVNDDHAPEFTSTATASVEENSLTAMTVVATDGDLPVQAINYSITGGDDQALFSIAANGDLSFVSAPDFEAPADADGDNIYTVQITADDGHGGVTTQQISVTVTDVDETPHLSLNGPEATFIRKQPPVNVLPGVTVEGVANLAGGTLTLKTNAVGKGSKLLDIISFPPTSGLGSTAGPQFANGQLTLQIQLGQGATYASIQSFLRGINYSMKGKALKTPTRTLEVTLTTAAGASATITQTIHVRKKPS